MRKLTVPAETANMADSELSASELRMRYHRGGTVPDSDLTSSQLRARHGVPANKAGIYI